MHKLCVLGVSGNTNSGKDTVADYICETHGFTKMSYADPLKRFIRDVFYFSDEQLWGASSKRNSVDRRYDREDAWTQASSNIKDLGVTFVNSISGKENPEGYSSLVHWFSWLQEEYKGNLSPRVVLQSLGTDWGRKEITDSVWVDHLLSQAKVLLNENGDPSHKGYTAQRGVFESEHRTLGIVVSDIRFENEMQAIHKVGGAVVRIMRPGNDTLASGIGIEGHASEAHDYDFSNFDMIIQNDKGLDALKEAVDTYMIIFNSVRL
jgi:hypothetical protein